MHAVEFGAENAFTLCGDLASSVHAHAPLHHGPLPPATYAAEGYLQFAAMPIRSSTNGGPRVAACTIGEKRHCAHRPPLVTGERRTRRQPRRHLRRVVSVVATGGRHRRRTSRTAPQP